jgi:hypothetical protein
MSLLGKLREESFAINCPEDPWLAPLQRVRGNASGAPAQPHSGHVPPPGEADGCNRVDRCTRA